MKYLPKSDHVEEMSNEKEFCISLLSSNYCIDRLWCNHNNSTSSATTTQVTNPTIPTATSAIPMDQSIRSPYMLLLR